VYTLAANKLSATGLWDDASSHSPVTPGCDVMIIVLIVFFTSLSWFLHFPIIELEER
jgi:biopolymer transport protein ExbD